MQRGLLAFFLVFFVLVTAASAAAGPPAPPAAPARPDQPETVLHSDCPGGRPVAVAVLAKNDNRDAAAALEGALAAWHCVSVVLIPSSQPASSVDTDAEDFERAATEDVDWLIVARGSTALVNARLVDPALKEVLVLANGPPDEVAMELLAPVGLEMTRARNGGGRVVLSMVGVSYGDVARLEKQLRALPVFGDVKVGRFAGTGARFVVRTTAPRDALLDALNTVTVPGKATTITGIRLRRIELTFAPPGTPPT